jgi:hypothetical protein
MEALINSNPKNITISAVFNNEEVGRFKIKWKLNGKEKQNF